MSSSPSALRRRHEPLPAWMSRWGLAAALLLLAAALFHFQGNNAPAGGTSHSLLVWIGRQWIDSGGDFSHGWLMPLVSLAIVYRSRRELAAAASGPDRRGLIVVGLSLLLHVLAYRAQQPRLSLIALAGVAWGVPSYLYGWGVARQLYFPVGYLLLCFTSYALFYFTFQFRLLANVLSAALLNGIGIATQRQGTAIFSSAGGGFNFDIADPCSGLRSIVVMTALAAPYAYLTLRGRLRQWTLFVLSLPLAVLANALRIVTIALVAEGFGRELALRVYHDFSGYLLFSIAALLLVSTGTVLERVNRRKAAA